MTLPATSILCDEDGPTAESLSEIDRRLRKEFGDGYSQREFAVRSSVADEDGEKHSFAGQMDSFLFQRGLTAISGSVAKVLASAYGERAMSYRRQSGLEQTRIQSAVILQEMIEGEVSGVLFTAHPATGERDRMLISACYGAGDGVVSGACECDEYVVDPDAGLVSGDIREKTQRSVRSDQGVTLAPVDPKLASRPCLTDEQALELARLGQKAALLKGYPLDLEWTLRSGKIYLLQARPITKLPPRSKGQDSELVFDNSNIQESYCGVTTPLTFSFASRAYFEVYRQLMGMMGFSAKEVREHDRRHRELLALVNGRVYYNIGNWYRGLLFLPSFGRNKADMERMMGLTEPVDFVEDFKPGLRQKLATVPRMAQTLIRLLAAFARIDSKVARFEEGFEKKYATLDRTKLYRKDGRALTLLAEELVDRFLGDWDIPIINDFFVMMMNGKVVRRLKAVGHEKDLMTLLAGQELASTAPTKALLSLADEVRSSPWLCELFSRHSDSALMDAVRKESPKFAARVTEFIERFGDRCIGELKLESISMREDPSFVFAVVRNYLENANLTAQSFDEREINSRDRLEAKVLQAIRAKQGAFAAWSFRRDLAKLRKGVRYRESMRLARTRVFGVFRTIYLELGQRLRELGAIHEVRDVFYLTAEEIDRYFAGTSIQSRLKPLVESRKAEYRGYLKDDPGHRVRAASPVYAREGWRAKTDPAQTGTTLRGIGCFPGVVNENVRLVFSPEGNLDLKNRILCTMRTDPGWTPLFASISGLLVERGSSLSHSAVVARELGVPAIVGIPGITELLRDGERVSMDGAQGVVTRDA